MLPRISAPSPSSEGCIIATARLAELRRNEVLASIGVLQVCSLSIEVVKHTLRFPAAHRSL